MRRKDCSFERKSVRNRSRQHMCKGQFTSASDNFLTGGKFEEQNCRDEEQSEQRSTLQHRNQSYQNNFAGGGYCANQNTERQSHEIVEIPRPKNAEISRWEIVEIPRTKNAEISRPKFVEIPRPKIQKHHQNQNQNKKIQSCSNSHQSRHRSSTKNNGNNSNNNFFQSQTQIRTSVQLELINRTLNSIATKQPCRKTNKNSFIRKNNNNNNNNNCYDSTQQQINQRWNNDKEYRNQAFSRNFSIPQHNRRAEQGAARAVNRSFDSRNLNSNSNSPMNYKKLQSQNQSLPSNHEIQRFHANNSKYNPKYENQRVGNTNDNFTRDAIQHNYGYHKQENSQSAFSPQNNNKKNNNNDDNNYNQVRINKNNNNDENDWIGENENDTWGSYKQEKNLKFPEEQTDASKVGGCPNIGSNQVPKQSNSQSSNDRNAPAQNLNFSNFRGNQIPQQQSEDNNVKIGWRQLNQNDTFEHYQQSDKIIQKGDKQEQEEGQKGWAIQQKSRTNSQYQNLVDGFTDMESLQDTGQQKNFNLESRQTAEALDEQFISQLQHVRNRNQNQQQQKHKKCDIGNNIIINNFNIREDACGSNNQQNDDFQVGGRSNFQDFENQSQVQQNESEIFENFNENVNQDVQQPEFLGQEFSGSCEQQQPLLSTCDELAQQNENSFLQTRVSENGQQPHQEKESSISHAKNEGEDYLQQNQSYQYQQSSQQNLQEQHLHPQNQHVENKSDEQLQVQSGNCFGGQNEDDEQQQLQKYRQKQQSQYLRQKQNQQICDGSKQQLVQPGQRQFSNVENEKYLQQCDKIDQLFEERLDDDSRYWEPHNEEDLDIEVRNEGDVGESRFCRREDIEGGTSLQRQCCSKDFFTQQPLLHSEDQQSDEYSENLQSGRHMQQFQLSEGCNWQQQEDCSEHATSSAAWGYGSESFGSYKKEQCCVCGSDEKIVSVLTCGHQNMCWKCFLKLRLVYDKNECPVCREQILEVTLSAWPNYSFENRQKPQPSTCVPGLLLDVQSFKDAKLKVLIESFGSDKCPICVENDPENWRELPDFKGWKQLSDHFASHHQSVERRFLCFTCCEATSRYCNASLERYTKKELEEHIRDSHGYCYICRRNFYCNDQLNEHISTNHYRCDICPRYFSDKYRLKRHIQGSHHICQECRTQNAAEWHFDSWVGLQWHLQLWHPGALSIAAEYENDGGLPQQDQYEPFQNEARLDEEESRQHLWRQVNINVMDNVNLWLGNPNNHFEEHPNS